MQPGVAQRAGLPRGRPFTAPFVYSGELRDYAYWDYLFTSRLMHGPCFTQFSKPPQRVLAMGPGSEYWVLSTAKAWPDTVFYCYDLAGANAKLNSVLPHLNLSGRVAFNSATNTVLPLPYPDNHFDLVILRYAESIMSEHSGALGLQDMIRVLRSNGVLEYLGSDMIFPGAQNSPHSPHSAPDTTLPPSPNHSAPSSSRSNSASSSSEAGSAPRASSPNDPYDHSRLAAAWEEMLDARAIPQHVSSVVPLYLSAYSDNYQVLPVLDIYMPEPVQTGDQSRDLGGYKLGMGEHKPYSAPPTASSSSAWSECMRASAPMHLARAVQIVRHSRAAIWEAYEALYTYAPESGMRSAVKNVSGELLAVDGHQQRREKTLEQFERDWRDWELDMASRVGMRGIVREALRWKEGRGEMPAWRVWREKNKSTDALSSGSRTRDADVCRTLYAVLVFKSKDT